MERRKSRSRVANFIHKITAEALSSLKRLFQRETSSGDQGDPLLRDSTRDPVSAVRQRVFLENGSSLPSDAHARLLSRHNVLILSADEASSFVPPDPQGTVMIRIINPSHEFPCLSGEFRDVLECHFFDLESASDDEATMGCGAYRLIAKEAERIVPFLQENLDRLIVVHCHAGISRSAAVASFALSLRKDGEGVSFIERNEGEWSPNFWVLRALMDTYGKK